MMSIPADSSGRRRTLSLLVNAAVVVFGGGFSALLGLFAIRPARGATAERWIRAGRVTDLTAGVPLTKVLSVPRQDGWYRSRAPETVFLVWDGSNQVTAFSATCTHLGCQVLWDAAKKQFNCPCHGGVFDAAGRVVSGPPPRPLDTIETRVDPGDRSVVVRL